MQQRIHSQDIPCKDISYFATFSCRAASRASDEPSNGTHTLIMRMLSLVLSRQGRSDRKVVWISIHGLLREIVTQNIIMIIIIKFSNIVPHC